MRLILKTKHDLTSKWVAHYIVRKIILVAPTEEKPFVLDLAIGS